jgi:hypothetical protein
MPRTRAKRTTTGSSTSPNVRLTFHTHTLDQLYRTCQTFATLAALSFPISTVRTEVEAAQDLLTVCENIIVHSHYTTEYRRRRCKDHTERQDHDSDNSDDNDSFQDNNDDNAHPSGNNNFEGNDNFDDNDNKNAHLNDNDNFNGNDVNDNDNLDGNDSIVTTPRLQMMRFTGPRGLGEQGLLGAPPITHKNKPKFFIYNTHTPHNTHTHNCGCTQSNINADTNATGDEVTNVSREERDQNNTDTTDGITAVRDFRDIINSSTQSVTGHGPKNTVCMR